MGRFGRGGDAPRVVGFDFSAPPPAPVLPPAPPPLAAAPAEPAPYEPYEPPPAPVATETLPPFQQYVPWVPPQPMGAPQLPKSKDAGIRREATVVGVLLLVVGLVAGVQRFRGGGDEEEAAPPAPRKVQVSVAPTLAEMNAPPSIGGEPRLATPASRALARGLRTILPNNGRHSEIEFYGAQEPRYSLIAGELVSGGSMRMLQYVDNRTSGTYDSPRTFPGGLVCASYAVPSGRNSICTWGTKRSDGIVFGYGHARAATLAPVALKAKKDFERGY